MQILDNLQIKEKIRRISYQILENHFGQHKIYLLGINNKGLAFAELLCTAFNELPDPKPLIELYNLRLNPRNPLKNKPEISGLDINELKGQDIIIVDDVANTGRTLFYAFQPLLQVLPGRVEVAVMVDRKHKLFPVHVDYMGLSLVTTLKENIEFTIAPEGSMKAELH